MSKKRRSPPSTLAQPSGPAAAAVAAAAGTTVPPPASLPATGAGAAPTTANARDMGSSAGSRRSKRIRVNQQLNQQKKRDAEATAAASALVPSVQVEPAHFKELVDTLNALVRDYVAQLVRDNKAAHARAAIHSTTRAGDINTEQAEYEPFLPLSARNVRSLKTRLNALFKSVIQQVKKHTTFPSKAERKKNKIRQQQQAAALEGRQEQLEDEAKKIVNPDTTQHPQAAAAAAAAAQEAEESEQQLTHSLEVARATVIQNLLALAETRRVSVERIDTAIAQTVMEQRIVPLAEDLDTQYEHRKHVRLPAPEECARVQEARKRIVTTLAQLERNMPLRLESLSNLIQYCSSAPLPADGGGQASATAASGTDPADGPTPTPMEMLYDGQLV